MKKLNEYFSGAELINQLMQRDIRRRKDRERDIFQRIKEKMSSIKKAREEAAKKAGVGVSPEETYATGKISVELCEKGACIN